MSAHDAMHASEIKHFLITYDVAARKPSIRKFGTDYDAALKAYEQAEEDNRGNDTVEIVLLGADSLDTLKRTHSSYFATGEGFASILPDGILAQT